MKTIALLMAFVSVALKPCTAQASQTADDWKPATTSQRGRDVQGAGRWDPTMAGSFDEYLQKVAIRQVKELMAKIKPEVLWWDTPGRIMTLEGDPTTISLKLSAQAPDPIASVVCLEVKP